MYIIMFVSLTRACVVYVVKEVTSFLGELGQLMGVVCKRTRAQALQTSTKKVVAYIESGTNS